MSLVFGCKVDTVSITTEHIEGYLAISYADINVYFYIFVLLCYK